MKSTIAHKWGLLSLFLMGYMVGTHQLFWVVVGLALGALVAREHVKDREMVATESHVQGEHDALTRTARLFR